MIRRRRHAGPSGLDGRLPRCLLVLGWWTAAGPLAPTDAWAGAGTASVAADRVVVRAPSPLAATDGSASVKVIGRVAITRAIERGSGLGDVLDAVAGFRVLDYGGPVLDKRVSVRGGSPGQTLIVVDGVPMTSAFATGLDVGFVDLEAVQSVELVRGGAGAWFGEGALTGAVLVSSRRADRTPASVKLGFGDLGTAQVGGTVSAGSLSLIGSYEQTEGGFEYLSSIRGLPDRVERRDNSAARRGRLAARWDAPLLGGQLFLAGGASLREAGIAGLETQEDLDAREQRGTARLRVGWRKQAGLTRVQTGAFTSLLSIDYDDPDPALPIESSSLFASVGADAAVTSVWGEHHLATARLDAAFERSDSTEHGLQSRGRGGLALRHEGDFDPWFSWVALRAELIGGLGVSWMPRLGLRWEPEPGWALRLSAGRSVRAPAIDELFHPSEGGIEGNPTLVPEAAWEAELAGELTAADLGGLSVSAFARSIEDTILYVNRNAFVVRPENLGASRAVGVEVDADAAVAVAGHRLGGALALSWLHARFADTGQPLPTQPDASAHATVSFEPRIAGSYPFELFCDLRLVRAAFANIHASVRTNEYARWDVGLSVRPFPGAVATVVMTNVLNDQRLVTVHKGPLPGRMVLATVRVTAGEDP